MQSLVSCKSSCVTRDAFSNTTQLRYCTVNGKGPSGAEGSTSLPIPLSTPAQLRVVSQEALVAANTATARAHHPFKVQAPGCPVCGPGSPCTSSAHAVYLPSQQSKEPVL